jgi:hypothetical protein
MCLMVAPTAIGTFRDKRGRFWVSIEGICDFLGASLVVERRRIKALGIFHPHTFQRFRTSPGGSPRRYFIHSLPAKELARWIAAIAEFPSYKCPKTGIRLTVQKERLSLIRRSIKQQKALHKTYLVEQAISA